MLIYIGIISVLYVLSFAKIKHKKFAYWICVSVLAIVSGIRYEVGADWGMYVNEYEKMFQGHASREFEGLYLLLEKIFCGMGYSNAYAMLFGIAVFTVFVFARTIEKNVEEKYWFFSLALFVTTVTYFATMNAVRQFLAIAVLLLGLKKLQEEKYWQYFIFIIIASFFQSIALVLAIFVGLLFLLKRCRGNPYVIMQIFFLFSLTGLFIDYTSMARSLIQTLLPATSRFQGYISISSGLYYSFFVSRNYSAIFKTVFPNIMWICIFIRRDQIPLPKNIKEIYFTAFLMFLFFNNLFYGINIFIRLGYLFEYYILFLFPAFLASFQDARKRFIGKVCILGYYLVLTSYGVFWQKGQGVLPYQTFLFK